MTCVVLWLSNLAASHSPIQALDLVGQHYSGDRSGRGKRYFKRVALNL